MIQILFNETDFIPIFVMVYFMCGIIYALSKLRGHDTLPRGPEILLTAASFLTDVFCWLPIIIITITKGII